MKHYRPLLSVIGLVIFSWSGYSLFITDDVKLPEMTITQGMKGYQPKLENLEAMGQDVYILKGEVSRLEGNIVSLREHLDQLKKEVKTGSEMLAKALALVDTDVNLQVADHEDSPQSAEVDQQHAEQVAEQTMAVIESSFDNEEVDNNWSAESTEVIQKAFETDELKSISVLDMECRSTLCKVEVQHDDAMQQGAFELFFPMNVAESLPEMTMHQEQGDDGSITTVVYLSKDGYDMPYSE